MQQGFGVKNRQAAVATPRTEAKQLRCSSTRAPAARESSSRERALASSHEGRDSLAGFPLAYVVQDVDKLRVPLAKDLRLGTTSGRKGVSQGYPEGDGLKTSTGRWTRRRDIHVDLPTFSKSTDSISI